MLFIIAGELSGDRLGGRLLAALKARGLEIGQVQGIAGPWMQEQGMSSLFPMEELSLMGFAEVLPHIFRLKRRIRQTVAAIEAANPKVLLTIDSPGFNFRVVKLLKERGKVRPRLIHYVAPTVWAYKPERAAKTAALFDELLVLLPFEPPYFTVHGLPTPFVGHPVVDARPEGADEAAQWRAQHGIAAGTPVITLFAGSRRGELKRLLPVYQLVLQRLRERMPDLVAVLPVPAYVEHEVRAQVAHWHKGVIVLTQEHEKWAATAASRVALVKSGTIALEVAMCGTPMVTVYQANPITAWMVRRMLQTKYVNLINVVLDAPVIPELLQEDCTPEAITAQLLPFFEEDAKVYVQREAMLRAVELLRAPGGGKAHEAAAAVVAPYLFKE